MNNKRNWELPTFRRFPQKFDGGVGWCIYRKFGLWHLKAWNSENAASPDYIFIEMKSIFKPKGLK